MSFISVTYNPSAHPKADPFLCAFQHTESNQYSASVSVLRTGCGGRDPQLGDSVTIDGSNRLVQHVDFTSGDIVFISLNPPKL